MITEFCCYGSMEDFLRKNRKNFVGFNNVGINFPDSLEDSKFDQPNYIEMKDTQRYVKMEVCRTNSNVVIDSNNLLSWSFQVVRRIDYLASKKVLHGDLAARNVLLTEDDVVKICDFGLAKSLHKNLDYKRTKPTLLPIKWLALESITDQTFSVYSDVLLTVNSLRYFLT